MGLAIIKFCGGVALGNVKFCKNIKEILIR